MFQFKCFEYLKELEQQPQNENLHLEFVSFLSENKDKVEEFIIQNSTSIKPEQKQILLESFSQAQQSTQLNNQNNNFQNSQQSFQLNQNSSQEQIINDILTLFEEWKTEYFKLREVTPKCIEIAEIIVNNYLLMDLELIKIFQELSVEQNEAFKKFKNHIINVLAVILIDKLQIQIEELKTFKLGFIKKWLLILQLEKEQKKISKKKFDINELEEIFQLIEIVKGGNN